jgi:hypothetical protein
MVSAKNEDPLFERVVVQGLVAAGSAAAAGFVTPELAIATAGVAPAASILLERLIDSTRKLWVRRAERIFVVASSLSGRSAEDLLESVAETESGFIETFLRAVVATGSAEEIVLLGDGLRRAAEQNTVVNQIEFEKDLISAVSALGGSHLRVLNHLAGLGITNQTLTEETIYPSLQLNAGIIKYPRTPLERRRMVNRVRRNPAFYPIESYALVLMKVLLGHIRKEPCVSEVDLNSAIRSVFPSAWDNQVLAQALDDFQESARLQIAGVANRLTIEKPAITARLIAAGTLTPLGKGVFVVVPLQHAAAELDPALLPMPPEKVSVQTATHSLSPFGMEICKRLDKLSDLIADERAL